MRKKWDLIIAGGGLSGTSAAIVAARKDCSVLLIEKMGFLGGCATASLVTPMMLNNNSAGNPLNTGIYQEIINRLTEKGHASRHSNGNPGWFNPEEMKFLLDDMCSESSVHVLFDTYIAGTAKENEYITSINCLNKAGFEQINGRFFIDATGDADLAFNAGVACDIKNHQALSLRFIMDNVNIYKFSQWLTDIEPEMEMSSVEYKDDNTVLLTTACTSENLGWKLRPYFALGIKDGIINKEDAEYFQIFTVPGQKNAIAFNCPRVYSRKSLDPLNPWDISLAYRNGRKQIKRLENFCKTYLTGFEDAYISQIAPSLGIRNSRMIQGKYKLTEEDIMLGKKFKNAAAKSNYPIDIHGNEDIESELTHSKNVNYYEIPLEAMMPKTISNLLVVGKPISSTFKAQSSARIMPNCIAMGEYAGNYWADRINI